MDKYVRKVFRKDFSVIYEIYREGVLVAKRELKWYNLPHFKAVFRCSDGTERSVEYLFELAHKESKAAIAIMLKHEIGENCNG